MSERPKTTDCYSASERGMMLWSQEIRARALKPVLRVLTYWRCTPDQITLLSLISGIAFLPVFLFLSKPLALTCIALHVALDGLDGPLARFQGNDSPKGSFTDTVCDQIVVTTTTICLMLPAVGLIEISAGGAYIFLYGAVVAFAMIRNAMEIPYSLLIRPRFLIYVWIAVEVLWGVGWINHLIWIANIFLGSKMLTGYIKIRRQM